MKIVIAHRDEDGSLRIDMAAGTASARPHEIILCTTPDQTLAELAGAAPDCVVVPFDMPGLGGIKGIETLYGAAPGTPVFSAIAQCSLELSRRVFNAGAMAVVPPDVTLDAITPMIDLARRGHRMAYCSNDMPEMPLPAAASLSERELQVLAGICEGRQNKEIAHSFRIQEVTVKMHVRAIIRKLDARNRTHAAMMAFQMGLC